MVQTPPAPDVAAAATLVRSTLKSQYHAGLAMLRQAIEDCPDDLWASRERGVPFWRIVYHVLYYVHFYTRPAATDFTPWAHHQTGLQDLDDVPAPPDLIDLCELPHRPPQTGEPHTRARLLEYLELCAGQIDDSVDALDVFSLESGFSWYRLPKLEHQIVAIRHISHHLGQLGVRLREAGCAGVAWVGARR